MPTVETTAPALAHSPAPVSLAPSPTDLPGGVWPAPHFSTGRILRYLAGIRPYRRGDARLEAEQVDGVEFLRRKFDSTHELIEISSDVIANCLGLGAGALISDRSVVPIRGQLVHLEPKNLPYMLSHSGYLFPRSDAIILGGTVERGSLDTRPSAARCQRLLRDHANFFGQRLS